MMVRGCLPFILMITVINMLSESALAVSTSTATPITEGAPVLAPFQHVRFCLRYPTECKSDSLNSDQIDVDTRTMDLIRHINHDVNSSIAPMVKSYGPKLEDSWAIAPAFGDCNDYAVTKRHELLNHGLAPNALRLSVVMTPSGVGHLVLVVVTTKGSLVMDNLTETIRPWSQTKYRWLKIQSAKDPKLWYEVKAPADGFALSTKGAKVRLANR